MAHLSHGLMFTGSLSNLSAYRMRGSDKIIVRTKGGPNKKQIKNDPNFHMTRRHNAEFGGRATATSWIRFALNPILKLADYNIAGPLNALVKPLQHLDTTNDLGKRNIYFSRQPGLLQGFQLNKRNPFDQIVRSPITCTLSKDEGTARIDIPLLIPGINLFVPGNFSYYSISAVLGILPDLDFHEQGYKDKSDGAIRQPVDKDTDWHLVSKGSGSQTIELTIKKPMAEVSFCLLVSVGIRFGNPGVEKVEQVKYAGAGKVLAVV